MTLKVHTKAVHNIFPHCVDSFFLVSYENPNMELICFLEYIVTLFVKLSFP